ncbi:hypothetical protein EV175_004153, partial [Coemansia sp. RSA 1933]
RANTSQNHSSATQNAAASSSSTPPRIRQTRSEVVHPAHGGHDGMAKYASGQQQDDPSKGTNYALWMPWEEATLVDWLFEPTNCKLFNEPRRKKECHERIIRDILPNKTSRAIEGKIRTLEKRYQKAAGEIQREDFATIHPGKRPDDVAEALCINFRKLETIFNTTLGHRRVSHPQITPHQSKRKVAPWGSKSGLSATSTDNLPSDGAGGVASQMPPASSYDHPTTVASHAAASGSNDGSNNNGTGGLSVPGGDPPRITSTESLPLPYRIMAYGRKIAPKRDSNNASPVDGAEMSGEVPNMMGPSKRSRTLPATMQIQRSPGFGQSQSKQPSQLLTLDPRYANNSTQQQQQQQHPHQQQRYYENSSRYTHEMAGRPSTATLPMMLPLASPMGNSSQAVLTQPASASSALPPPPQNYPQQLMANNGPLRDAYDHGHTRSVSNPGAIQGTREELEWLQFNLRREELEFRKTVFAQEQELEAKRVRLEERRLEIKRHELELEGKRADMQRQQMDLQLETMKSMATMLNQMTKQMSSIAEAAPAATDETSSSDSSSKQHDRSAQD